MSIFDRLFGRKDSRISVAAAAEKESPVRNLAADLPDEETAVAVATGSDCSLQRRRKMCIQRYFHH